MSAQPKQQWYTQYGTSLMHDGAHVCDVRSRNGDPDQDDANAKRIVACLNACDGYTTEQLQSLAGGNVKREVTHFADQLGEAEGRYLRAEGIRDALLAALEALLEHEGTVDHTGIGELPSEALGLAREQAVAAVADAKRKIDSFGW